MGLLGSDSAIWPQMDVELKFSFRPTSVGHQIRFGPMAVFPSLQLNSPADHRGENVSGMRSRYGTILRHARDRLQNT